MHCICSVSSQPLNVVPSHSPECSVFLLPSSSSRPSFSPLSMVLRKVEMRVALQHRPPQAPSRPPTVESFVLRLEPSMCCIAGKQDLCLTPYCIKAGKHSSFSSTQCEAFLYDVADYLIESIDETVEPCEDFFHFVCGTWIKNTRIPDDGKPFITNSDRKHAHLPSGCPKHIQYVTQSVGQQCCW